MLFDKENQLFKLAFSYTIGWIAQFFILYEFFDNISPCSIGEKSKLIEIFLNKGSGCFGGGKEANKNVLLPFIFRFDNIQQGNN